MQSDQQGEGTRDGGCVIAPVERLHWAYYGRTPNKAFYRSQVETTVGIGVGMGVGRGVGRGVGVGVSSGVKGSNVGEVLGQIVRTPQSVQSVPHGHEDPREAAKPSEQMPSGSLAQVSSQ